MGWIVLLPPVLAIVLALWTRQVYLSLGAGLMLGTTILAGGNPVAGLRLMVDQLVQVFADSGNTRVVFFCLLVGGQVALVQASGGVQGFIELARSRGWGTTRRGAELLAWIVGLIVFVESSITCLVVGAVSRPLFDELKIPREKLAYYCDVTSAPVCMAIPLNGWGAYVLGLLAAQGVVAGAVSLFASSLVFNFYSLFSIFFSLVLAVTGWGFGAMKTAERRALATGELLRPGAVPMMPEGLVDIQPEASARPRAFNLLFPIGIMVVMIFTGLWITGNGDFMKGSGSTAVLWAVGTSILISCILYAIPRNPNRKPILSIARSTDLVLNGMAGLLAVTLLIVLAFALGQVSRELGMGTYLVHLIEGNVPTWWLPALVFVVGSIISFTLGSSWTTFAILMPIALPLAEGLGIDQALMLGSVLSAGVFGDHASPLSDTTIISSMSSACDHIDHTNTQLPYALLVALISVAAYLVAGWVG